MENLPKYYTVLFNAVTDALHLLEKGDVGSAKGMLIWGQQQAEEAYLSGESNPRGRLRAGLAGDGRCGHRSVRAGVPDDPNVRTLSPYISNRQRQRQRRGRRDDATFNAPCIELPTVRDAPQRPARHGACQGILKPQV